MAEKKYVSKVESGEKRTFMGKAYLDFEKAGSMLFNGRRRQERMCRADISDVDKSMVSGFGTTDYLSPRDAVQRMYSNDPEVRKLQRKNVINTLEGPLFPKDPDDELGWGAMMRKALQEGTDKPLDEVCKKGVPAYIYEPNVRYKRIENPDYKRHKKYSIAGTLTGVGMLATGLASGILVLAYSGAALAIASFGYRSGQWLTNRKEDQSFEKLPLSLSELEKKVKKPGSPGSHSLSNHAGSLSDIAAKESKDDALYVRRLYRAVTPRNIYEGIGKIPFHYTSIDSWKHPTASGWGWLGVGLTALTAVGALFPGSLMSFTQAGYLGLATLSHYLGSFFGYKDTPEYQKV